MKPRRIAVICTRRLGDVLLTTALIRSLRRAAEPGTVIEALVAPGTGAALHGNPDLDAVIEVPLRPRLIQVWQLCRRIFRRYDLALATLVSDRAHLLAFLAARRRVNVVPPDGEPGARWKRRLSWRAAPLQTHRLHVVAQSLCLLPLIDVPAIAELVPPRPADAQALPRKLGRDWDAQPFAVVHPAAMYPYKGWTAQGWREVLAALVARGLRVYLTGGPAAAERELVAAVASGQDPAMAVDVAGRLEFAELTPLFENARVFVGPDTSVTHLAAATGVPTVALFGPSGPMAWGPWPKGWRGGAPSPWKLTAPLQQVGNVWLVQGLAPCVPCLQEGCARHPQSRSACLDELPAARVIAVVNAVLGEPVCTVRSGSDAAAGIFSIDSPRPAA